MLARHDISLWRKLLLPLRFSFGYFSHFANTFRLSNLPFVYHARKQSQLNYNRNDAVNDI